MQLDFTDEERRFRDEVREFIATHYPAEVRERQQQGLELRKQDYLAWHQAVARRGWSVPAWPVEYGGTGWTPTQRPEGQGRSLRLKRLPPRVLRARHPGCLRMRR